MVIDIILFFSFSLSLFFLYTNWKELGRLVHIGANSAAVTSDSWVSMVKRSICFLSMCISTTAQLYPHALIHMSEQCWTRSPRWGQPGRGWRNRAQSFHVVVFTVCHILTVTESHAAQLIIGHDDTAWPFRDRAATVCKLPYNQSHGQVSVKAFWGSLPSVPQSCPQFLQFPVFFLVFYGMLLHFLRSPFPNSF